MFRDFPHGFCIVRKESRRETQQQFVPFQRRPIIGDRDSSEQIQARSLNHGALHAIKKGRQRTLIMHQSLSPVGVVMSSVQIEQKSYEMPPREGISIAHFLTVTDIERSARYYEKVFGARILSLGDGNAPGYLQLANIWMILNVGGGPTPDKPTVTLSVPDPTHINSFMNFRVADIKACYELWKSRGAEFITAPIPKYGETRCYIRDPDGYIIEVGQSTDLTYG
jgi:predicted enzyme related to lactoylglutathione lyase